MLRPSLDFTNDGIGLRGVARLKVANRTPEAMYTFFPYLYLPMSDWALYGAVLSQGSFNSSIRNPYGDILDVKLESLVSRHQVGKNMDSICHEAIFTNCFCERLGYKGDAALASSAYLNGQDVRSLDAVVFRERHIGLQLCLVYGGKYYRISSQLP